MQWTNSGGGPLICGEMHVVAQWLGLHGLSADSRHRNDYERACLTSEYLETTACGDGHVLVLGDEPLQSSFFQNDRGELAIADGSMPEYRMTLSKSSSGRPAC